MPPPRADGAERLIGGKRDEGDHDLRLPRASGTNCAGNSVRFGSRPGSQIRGQGEVGLACPLMGEGQHADHGPAGGAGRGWVSASKARR